MYVLEIVSFSAYTVTLFAVAVIFRPNENSKILAQVNELLDETLTQVDEPSRGIQEIEMHERISSNQ